MFLVFKADVQHYWKSCVETIRISAINNLSSFEHCYKVCVESGIQSAGMGIVLENANFRASETDFRRREKKKKKNARGKKLNKKQKHAGSTDFSSTPNTREIIEARSHAAMARFSRLIMNTAAAVTVVGRY